MPDIETMGLHLDEPFGNSTDSFLDMSQPSLPSHMFLPTSLLPDPRKPTPVPNNLIPDDKMENTNPMQAIGLPDSSEPQSNYIISHLLRTDLYVVE